MRLYITVETTSREMDAKTFLACTAAAEGFDVTIGLEDMIRRVGALRPAGIFYDKAMHTDYPALFATMRRLGHRVAVNDEEGLVIIPERYHGYSISEAAEREVDLLLCWGEYQREVVRDGRPGLAAKAVPAGNVRMDLLRPELRPFHQPEMDAIRGEYGRFTLINTRFGMVNNAHSTEAIKKRIDAGELGPVETMRPFFERDMQVFRAFQEMVPALCDRFPDRTFVLRPHPSENLSFWQNVAASRPNLRIVRKGNVHKWLMAADMVVQSGCSTAVESLLCGTPCVSYLPVVSEGVAHKLSDAVSYNAFDLEDLCRFIGGEYAADMDRLQAEWRERAGHYIASVTGPTAAENTVAELKKLAEKPTRPDLPFALKTRASAVVRSWNRLLKYRLRAMSGKPTHAPDGKWKPMTLDEFRTLARRFSFYDKRFNQLEITAAYPDCFRLRMSQ